MEVRRPARSQPGRGLRPGAGSSGREAAARAGSALHPPRPGPGARSARSPAPPPGCASRPRRARLFVCGRACCCGCHCSGCPGWELGGVPRRLRLAETDKDVENDTHTLGGEPRRTLVHSHTPSSLAGIVFPKKVQLKEPP